MRIETAFDWTKLSIPRDDKYESVAAGIVSEALSLISALNTTSRYGDNDKKEE